MTHGLKPGCRLQPPPQWSQHDGGNHRRDWKTDEDKGKEDQGLFHGVGEEGVFQAAAPFDNREGSEAGYLMVDCGSIESVLKNAILRGAQLIRPRLRQEEAGKQAE